MNIPEIIVELQKLAPDVPPEKRDDIAGFFVIDEFILNFLNFTDGKGIN